MLCLRARARVCEDDAVRGLAMSYEVGAVERANAVVTWYIVVTFTSVLNPHDDARAC